MRKFPSLFIVGFLDSSYMFVKDWSCSSSDASSVDSGRDCDRESKGFGEGEGSDDNEIESSWTAEGISD